MDFGTTANAAAMVQRQASIYSPLINIPGYDSTVTIASPALGGITVFAHFGKFYIEVSFIGYQDQSQAISDAKLFLDLIKSKIQ
jgi:hypothetical protein